jgi:regulator of sirC expression with transglutaminase-like and TPR domain
MANLAMNTVRRASSTACRAALLAALLTATPVTAETEPATSTTVIGGNEMLQAGADALREGDFQHGIELTLEGLKRPNAPREVAAALSNLCAGFVGVRQYDTALEKCNEALKIEANNWRTWNNRAAAYLGKGMYDAALRDVESGLEHQPESSTLKKTRKIVLERQRAREEQKRDALKT